MLSLVPPGNPGCIEERAFKRDPCLSHGKCTGLQAPGLDRSWFLNPQISAFSPWSGTVQLVCCTSVTYSEDLLLFLCRNRSGHYALRSVILSVVLSVALSVALRSQFPICIRDALEFRYRVCSLTCMSGLAGLSLPVGLVLSRRR